MRAQVGLAVALGVLTLGAPAAQPVNPHADEKIGTVQQVYDGTLLPDVQVNTFRNIDRLFPTRVVKHGAQAYPLPLSDQPLKNVRFKSGGKDYDLFEYVSLNRVSGLLVLKSGRIVFETYQSAQVLLERLGLGALHDPSPAGHDRGLADAAALQRKWHGPPRDGSIFADHRPSAVNSRRLLACFGTGGSENACHSIISLVACVLVDGRTLRQEKLCCPRSRPGRRILDRVFIEQRASVDAL